MAKKPDPNTLPHGVLVVDKPSGPTSHDLVSQARRVFSTRSVGHAGTLDPMATGVLLLLFGEATKLSSWLTLANKRYSTSVFFGVESNTLDALGELNYPGEPLTEINPSSLHAAIQTELTRTEQIPPEFSAVQVDGQRAYRAARAGAPLTLPPRPVQVHELQLISQAPPNLDFELLVSKGYYIRAFARDISASLNTVGHLTRLRRLQSGPFTISEACAWPPETTPQLINPSTAAARCLHQAHLSDEGNRVASFGQALSDSHFLSPPPPHPLEPNADEPAVAWFHQGRLVALGRGTENGEYRVVRGFNPSYTGPIQAG